MYLKLGLMSILLLIREHTSKNLEEVHWHGFIRTEIQNSFIQLKKVMIAKLTVRSKILYLHLALAGLICDLMDSDFKVIFMPSVS